MSDMPVQHPGYWSIQRPYCEVTIEKRPAHCDRGRYLAKVFPRGFYQLGFDDQDGWPRYYFDWDRMLAEIGAWLAIRDTSMSGETGVTSGAAR